MSVDNREIEVISFVVREAFGNTITIEYSEEITDARQPAAYDVLQRSLMSLDGVENVNMRRYSAVVRFADHIIDADVLEFDIEELFLDQVIVDEIKLYYPDVVVRDPTDEPEDRAEDSPTDCEG